MNKPTTTEEYLAALTAEKREAMEQIRKTIEAAAPKAEPAFSYGIPGFKLNGKPLLWLAAWKHHYSIYPLTQAVAEAAGADLDGYETSKGTVKFPEGRPIPFKLIGDIVRIRVKELDH